MLRYPLFLVMSIVLLVTPAGLRAEDAGTLAPESLVRQGAGLYAEHCARCHRPLEKTTKPGRSASRLRSAMRQFPAMASLDALTDEQLTAVSAALKTISPDSE